MFWHSICRRVKCGRTIIFTAMQKKFVVMHTGIHVGTYISFIRHITPFHLLLLVHAFINQSLQYISVQVPDRPWY